MSLIHKKDKVKKSMVLGHFHISPFKLFLVMKLYYARHSTFYLSTSIYLRPAIRTSSQSILNLPSQKFVGGGG